MALNDILDKIKKDAEKKAHIIKQKNQQQISELKTQQKQELKKLEKELRGKNKLKAINFARGILIEITNQNKNELLTQKRVVIQKIIQQTIKNLAQDTTKKKQLFEKLLKEIDQSDLNDVTIYVQAKDKSIIEEIAKKTLSKKFNLKISDKISSGFLVVSGQTTIDMSFENLFNENKSIIERTLAKEL